MALKFQSATGKDVYINGGRALYVEQLDDGQARITFGGGAIFIQGDAADVAELLWPSSDAERLARPRKPAPAEK